MKHLTNPTAPRFLLWTIMCVFLLALAGPGTTLARGPEYTCGSGMTEGDPGDGLEYSGGGGGSDSIEDLGLVNFDPKENGDDSSLMLQVWTQGTIVLFGDPISGALIPGKLLFPNFGEVFE
ncbi:hypothetical protein KJ682_04185 [bacterium]|nr:hypothetical protein [bacterium]